MKSLWMLTTALSLSGAASADVTYQLLWKNQKPLDFKYQLFELSPAFASKVGTHGTIVKVEQLMPLSELKNGEVAFKTRKEMILALVVRSESGRAFDFYVAPHHTHPEMAGLDFKFNCLCYHHVYHLEQGKLWYRILRLSHSGEIPSGENKIKLEHEAVPWTKKEAGSEKK